MTEDSTPVPEDPVSVVERKARDAVLRGGPLTVLPPGPAPVFGPAQTVRAEALRVARDIVVKKGSVFGGSGVEVGVPDLVDLAMYIVDGKHPINDYYTDEDPTPLEDA